MVQAIQVLRFHLLELEKVSIFHVSLRRCLARRYRPARCRAIRRCPVLLIPHLTFLRFI